MYPIGYSTGSEHHFDWIPAHEEYKTWINSQKPSILHVYGTSNAPEASEFIFRSLDSDWEIQKKNRIVTYFSFEKNDDRCNSTMAMLNTLLIQIINECQDLYNTVKLLFDEMSHHCSWTKTDLLLLFRNILLNCEYGCIMCVVNTMSECDTSFFAFLDEISSFARLTERRFKVAVTSTTNYNLQSVLAGWPAIDLDDHQEDANIVNQTLASDVDRGVLELMRQRSELYAFEKRITQMLFNCGQDKHWRSLVLNQLRFIEGPLTRLATERQLDVLPSTTYAEILSRILASIPPERQRWARTVLLWTLHAFHPLSVWELSTALVLHHECLSSGNGDIDEAVSQDIAGELDRVFRGIFMVKHNEVHFSHPDAREFLQNVNCGHDGAWYDVQETAHQEITEACFFYLSLPQVQKSIITSYIYPPTDLLESTAYIPRYSLCSYAVKYWPRHYKLIPRMICPTERALEFCRNAKAMRISIQAHWSLWKPNSRIDRVFLSTLPVLAGLGLQDLVAEWLGSKTQPSHTEDYAVALAEAARNAEIEVVRTLLPISRYSQSNLEDTLTAASSCSDEAVLDLLVTHIVQRYEYFQWPPALLCRTAQFGLENVVKSILKCGASLEVAVTYRDLTPLHLAARYGQVKVAEILLKDKASLTAVNENGLTPLHIASKYNQATVLSLLLNAHADCNAMDNDGNTALDFACRNGGHKVVEMLLTKIGCDIGSDKQGTWSPLSTSSHFGFYKCAQLLLEKAAKIEVCGTGTGIPLRHAALNSHLELCQLLLEYGANPNTSSDGDYLISESIKGGNLEVVKILIEHGAEIDVTDSEGQNALQKAAVKGDKALVAYLLDHGADVYHADGNGFTSTHFAARNGFAEIVQLLIDNGADPQRQTSDGRTPLHSCYHHAETAHTLLKNGVDVNKVTKHGFSPLYIAAYTGNVDVVKILLSYNPDLELTSPDRHPALIAATLLGKTEVMRLLLEAGANVNYQTEAKRFPLQYAVEGNMENILRVLMEYNPEVNFVGDHGKTALHCMNSDSSVTVIKILVNGGADLNIRDKNQDTPICSAVWSRNSEALKYLAKKAKLDIVGGIQGGPLHIACYQSELHLVKILVDAGADVNLVDPTAGTPLQIACCCRPDSSKEDQESVILYLINEANVDLHTIGGLLGCAINAACGWTSSEVVRLMLEKGASIETEDNMGRTAVHFAAARSIGVFEEIFGSGGDVGLADTMGRTALHWASASGIAYVVNRIISASRNSLDQGDRDGWTPLLWAARGCNTTLNKSSSSEQEEIIKLLLDRGADPCVTTKGLYQDWSPVKVARYHGADSRVIRLLEETAKEKLKDTQDEWDEEFHMSREADERDVWCDCCFVVGDSLFILAAVFVLAESFLSSRPQHLLTPI